MSFPFILLGFVAGYAVPVMAASWELALKASEAALLAWAGANHPQLTDDIRAAYRPVDQAAEGSAVTARQAWLRIRRWLVAQRIEYARTTDGGWQAVLTSYLRTDTLSDSPGTVMRSVSVFPVTSDGLLSDLESVYRSYGRSSVEFDITRLRDIELGPDGGSFTVPRLGADSSGSAEPDSATGARVLRPRTEDRARGSAVPAFRRLSMREAFTAFGDGIAHALDLSSSTFRRRRSRSVADLRERADLIRVATRDAQ